MQNGYDSHFALAVAWCFPGKWRIFFFDLGKCFLTSWKVNSAAVFHLLSYTAVVSTPALSGGEEPVIGSRYIFAPQAVWIIHLCRDLALDPCLPATSVAI